MFDKDIMSWCHHFDEKKDVTISIYDTRVKEIYMNEIRSHSDEIDYEDRIVIPINYIERYTDLL